MKGYTPRRDIVVLALGAALFAGACGREEKPATVTDNDKREVASEQSGRAIVVEAYSDAKGSYFKPAEIEARRGDVVRFVLKSGVHNINFLADSNPGKTGLPPASDMLQLPDQTYDVKVSFGEGRYYFQCDPHVALGMKGYLKVED